MAQPEILAPTGYSVLEMDLQKADVVTLRYLDESGHVQEVVGDRYRQDDFRIVYRPTILVTFDVDDGCGGTETRTVAVPIEKLVTAKVSVPTDPRDVPLGEEDSPMVTLWVWSPTGKELIAVTP